MSSIPFRAVLLLGGLLTVSACSDEKTPAGPPPGPAPFVAPAAAPAPPVVAVPPSKPETSLIEPSRDLGGVLPLKHGFFVEVSQDCGSPPNAGLRRYDGQGLSGAHTRACRAKVLSRKGTAYEIEQSCIDAGAGPAPRSTDRQTIIIANNLEFTQRGRGGAQSFRYCAASLLPPGLK
jgi:hypothetical protein